MRKLPYFQNSAILAWARDEGPETLSTQELEGLLLPLYREANIPSGIVEKMTGIKSRNLYPKSDPPLTGAVNAAKSLFYNSGFHPEHVDLLYSTSVGREFLEPSTASFVQNSLNIGPNATSLDIGSACLGFMDGLMLASLQLECGLIDYALVVAGENSRMVLENTVANLLKMKITVSDFFTHFATLTLGSGGAAMLLGKAEDYPRAPRIRAVSSLSDPDSFDLCRGDMTFMETDASRLLTKGVELARKTFNLGKTSFGWDEDYFDLIISHQVSEVNTRRFAQTLNLPWERVKKTYPLYGNMGPVAIPFAFDLCYEEGLIHTGMNIAFMGIGSGLACSMLEITVPDGFSGIMEF
jgi:3-oxoacyl-[acyl-carrier-protein] synthase-3